VGLGLGFRQSKM